MIRHDYILRMIEEFARVISAIVNLRREEKWDPAAQTIDDQCKRLIGVNAAQALELSETQLLARILQTDSAHAVREKTLFLVALLKQAGDLDLGKNRIAEAHAAWLKALHLLLHVLAQNDVFDLPGFVPSVEMLVDPLRHTALPMQTHALLMQHYERTGEFARAEDALFALLDAAPDNPDLVQHGIAFYQRLLPYSNETLSRGDLPRSEIETGLAELQRRAARV